MNKEFQQIKRNLVHLDQQLSDLQADIVNMSSHPSKTQFLLQKFADLVVQQAATEADMLDMLEASKPTLWERFRMWISQALHGV